MAEPTIAIIETLRRTARSLAASQDYQWGHMGSCNCGFLAQQVTHHDRAHIHNAAMQQCGDWTEQLNDYCPTSSMEMNSLIGGLLMAGFTIDDLKHLERLSDPDVLRASGKMNLRYNVKQDVIKYLVSWANLLETRLLCRIRLPDLSASPVDTGKVYNPSALAPDLQI